MPCFISRLLAISLTAFIILPTHTSGLSCYQCGTESIFTDGPVKQQVMEAALFMESCESFEGSFTWSLFAISCPESQICTKSITPGPTGMRTVRGCSQRNDSLGQLHRLGCGKMESSRMGPSDQEFTFGDEICMCDTDYCNSASINLLSCAAYLLIVINFCVGYFQ